MNARILELLRQPEMIQSGDLGLLESEIKTKPYIQNIRALYLYGTHRFNPENYQKELSKTAAYTTDKKILYHFINKNILESRQEESNSETTDYQESISDQSLPEMDKEDETTRHKEASYVEINGERNRILFEGEDNFLNEDDKNKNPNQQIANEWSDSGIVKETDASAGISDEELIVVETQEIDQQGDEVKAEPENIAKQEATEVSGILQEQPAELSFHGIDHFMPNVAVPGETKIETYQPKPTFNRHEEEMKRLIEEVEAKIKAKKQQQQMEERVPEEEPVNFETNFADTQNFDLKSDAKDPVEHTATEIVYEDNQSEADEHETSHQQTVNTEETIEHSSWQPMNFTSNTPDALIKKEISEPNMGIADQKKTDPAVTRKEISPDNEGTPNEKEDRPVFNVSFFSPSVSKIEEKTPETTGTVKKDEHPEDSNVPKFINTWQNWLKIERKEAEVSKEEIKEKAIEKFIEQEPKISKLKEESGFVVKEKSGDISHLMTETLAKLYLEQRLYTKAIKAFEILKEKHPEKSGYFTEKINEIKELRLNK